MILLSVSTSGNIASAALLKDGKLLELVKGERGLTHSETILPLCEQLLKDYNFTARDVDAYAVDIGPGSFTGVRIGVCAMNAMAAASIRPIAAVCSLDALYESVREYPCVCALIDAKGKKVYAAHFEAEKTTLQPFATTLDELLPLMPKNTAYVGDGAIAYETDILAWDETAVILPHALLADAVAFSGYKMYQRANTCSEALPLYLRPSQAERLRKE
jgi:tRNA threonylcarbamoyladenosine biosynthesis protein TsaB